VGSAGCFGVNQRSSLRSEFWYGRGLLEATSTETPVSDAPSQKAPAGWYEQGSTLRYWSGSTWTDHYAPLPQQAKTDGPSPNRELVWALSLAFGVAAALAWDAPVIAYYWPLGLGGAGLALAVVAYTQDKRMPWFAVIAVVASLIGIALGVAGHAQVEDARESLEFLK
jgi:Protein of unknown function (DUF2510)